jgi:hypothetical protein
MSSLCLIPMIGDELKSVINNTSGGNMEDKSKPRQDAKTTTDREEFEAAYAKMVCMELHVGNVDNKYLEPLHAGPALIGRVYEVNGDGAKELAEFVPTRHELAELVKFWEKTKLPIEWDMLLTGTVGSGAPSRSLIREIRRVAK